MNTDLLITHFHPLSLPCKSVQSQQLPLKPAPTSCAHGRSELLTRVCIRTMPSCPWILYIHWWQDYVTTEGLKGRGSLIRVPSSKPALTLAVWRWPNPWTYQYPCLLVYKMVMLINHFHLRGLQGGAGGSPEDEETAPALFLWRKGVELLKHPHWLTLRLQLKTPSDPGPHHST